MKKSSVLLFAFFVCVASILTSCSAGCPGYWRGNTVSPKAFRSKSAYKAPVQEKTVPLKEIKL